MRDVYDHHQRKRAAFRQAVFDRWGESCIWCGRPASTVDHIVHRSQLRRMFPDPDDYARAVFNPANGRPSCKPCNSSRGNRPVPKWVERSGGKRPPTTPTPTNTERDNRWHVEH